MTFLLQLRLPKGQLVCFCTCRASCGPNLGTRETLSIYGSTQPATLFHARVVILYVLACHGPSYRDDRVYHSAICLSAPPPPYSKLSNECSQHKSRVPNLRFFTT